MILASVVLPVPGGPQKIIEVASSLSMATRRGLPRARRGAWPTYSSRVCGRMRSACWGECEPLRREARAFVADQNCCGVTQVCVACLQHSWCVGAYGREEADAMVREGGQLFIACRCDGHTEDTAYAGSESLLVPRA